MKLAQSEVSRHMHTKTMQCFNLFASRNPKFQIKIQNYNKL